MMRRSTGMGGGGMLRAMGRAGGGVKERMSAGGSGGGGAKVVKPACVVSVSGSSPPLVALGSKKAVSCCLDTEEWERVEEEAEMEMEENVEESERFIFGPVPTKEEVEDAVSTLQQ